MTNKFYNYASPVVAGSTIRSDKYNTDQQGIDGAFESIEVDLSNRITLPDTFTGSPILPEVTVADTFLYINGIGNITLYPGADLQAQFATVQTQHDQVNTWQGQVSTNTATATTQAGISTAKAGEAAASQTASSTSETNAATSATNSATSATNAAGSATAAAASATSSGTNATAAATSSDNAGTSATTATTQAIAASASATSAAASMATVATSAANAATSETNAATSASTTSTQATAATTARSLAQEWADNAENTVVSGTVDYSAKHWAAKAAGTVTTALVGSNAATVTPHTGGGVLLPNGKVNQLRDSSNYTMPAANSLIADSRLIIELPDLYKNERPTVAPSGADLFINSNGTDTSLAFIGAAYVELVTDGVNRWAVYMWSNNGINGADSLTAVSSVAGKTGAVTLTAADVNLGSVNNSSDVNKPVSTATQIALNLKVDTTTLTTHTGNTTNPHSVTKAQVGLGSVDNTTDAAKPISNAMVTALAGKVSAATLTTHTDDANNPHSVTKSQVGLFNVNNTSDNDKPVSSAMVTALAGKVDDAQVLTNVPLGALFTDTNTTYTVGDGGLTQVNFTTADNTKLDGIAASANNYTLPASVVHATEAGALHATDALSIAGQVITLKRGNNATETVTIPADTTYTVGDGGLTQINFTSVDNVKLDGIASGAQVNTVSSVAGRVGAVTITKSDVGLFNVNNTSDANKPISTATQDAFDALQITYNNAATQAFTRQAINTYINRSGGAARYTLDESTFVIGDKVYVTKFYDAAGLVTITTDQGSIFLPDGSNSATQTLDRSGTICLEKTDATNWIARTA